MITEVLLADSGQTEARARASGPTGETGRRKICAPFEQLESNLFAGRSAERKWPNHQAVNRRC